MKRNKLRWLAGTLAVCLTITGLAGCGIHSKKDQEEVSSSLGEGQNHYSEAMIMIPDGEKAVSLMKDPEGKSILYTQKEGSINKYEINGDGAELQQEDTWITLGTDDTLEQIVSGEDGKEYALILSGEENLYILNDQDGTRADVPAKILDENKGRIYSAQIQVLSDGNYVLGMGNTIYCMDPNQNVLNQISVYNEYPDQKFPMSVQGEKILSVNDTGNGFCLYDATSGSESKKYNYTDISYDDKIAIDSNELVYIFNQKGIFVLQPEGEMAEQLLDGGIYHLGNPVYHVINMLQDQNKGYYILFKTDDGTEVYHYSYSEQPQKEMGTDTENTDSGKFTVYSLWKSSTVEYAVNIFKQKHPQVEVVYENAYDNDSSASSEEYIRALNAQIANGEGPDVFLLDGLPTDSYLQKGVFADISDVVSPYEEDGSLPEQFAEPYKKDGKLYAVTVRYGIPVLGGNDEIQKNCQTLDGFKAWMDSMPDVDIWNYGNYDEILTTLLYMYKDDVFDENGNMNQDKLALCMEAAKEITKRPGFEASGEDGLTEKEKMSFYESVLRGGKMDGLTNGEANIAFSEFTSPFYQMEEFSIEKQCPNTFQTMHGYYTPILTAALNSNTKSSAYGKEFIELLLSKDVQKQDFMEGFPCNSTAEEDFISDLPENVEEQQKGYCMGGEDKNGNEEIFFLPLKDEARTIFAKKDELKEPCAIDKLLLNMILTDADRYQDDSATKEEVAKDIVDKAKTYLK